MIVFNSLHDLRISDYKPSYSIVIDEYGKEHPYMLDGKRFDHWDRDIKAVKFIIKD